MPSANSGAGLASEQSKQHNATAPLIWVSFVVFNFVILSD
jgi:hypothetical protein